MFGAGGLRDDLQFHAVEDLAGRLDVQSLIVAGAAMITEFGSGI
jgi:hypothetical protein